MIIAAEQVDKYIKALETGAPKEAGKTTLALRATPEGPNMVLNYDIGNVYAPPGTDPKTLYVESYPAASYKMNASLDLVPSTLVGEKILRDAEEINTAFREQRPIKLGGITVPLPKTLILDGAVSLDNHIINFVMGQKGISSMDDYPKGKGKDARAGWNKRAQIMQAIYDQLMALPCNTIVITWEKKAMRTVIDEYGKEKQEYTGQMEPDCGGKFDVQVPGKVDASIYCYSNNSRFYVQLIPSATAKSIAVRGRFNTKLPPRIDVTLDEKGVKNPWEEILGRKLS